MAARPPKPGQAPEEIRDEIVSGDLELARAAAAREAEVAARVSDTYARATRRVRAIDPTGPAGADRDARQRRAELAAEETFAGTYSALSKRSQVDAARVGREVYAGTTRIINEAVGFPVANVPMTKAQADALTGLVLTGGASAPEYWARQGADASQRFVQAMQAGIRKGETIDQLTRRLLTEGGMDLSKAQARTLVRTSFVSWGNRARLDAAIRNSHVVKALAQHSTLDTRTTIICAAYSGKVWNLPGFDPVGHDLPWNGGPPRHFNCRSQVVPITRSWDELAAAGNLPPGGGQPSEPVERRFLRHARKLGLGGQGGARLAMMRTQASMDGHVPAALTFEEWLERQTLQRQLQVLGPTYRDLWANKKVPLRQLLDQSGRRVLSVQELLGRTGGPPPPPPPPPVLPPPVVPPPPVAPPPVAPPVAPARAARAMGDVLADKLPSEARFHRVAWGADPGEATREYLDALAPSEVFDPFTRSHYKGRRDLADGFYSAGEGVGLKKRVYPTPEVAKDVIRHEFGHHADWWSWRVMAANADDAARAAIGLPDGLSRAATRSATGAPLRLGAGRFDPSASPAWRDNFSTRALAGSFMEDRLAWLGFRQGGRAGRIAQQLDQAMAATVAEDLPLKYQRAAASLLGDYSDDASRALAEVMGDLEQTALNQGWTVHERLGFVLARGAQEARGAAGGILAAEDYAAAERLLDASWARRIDAASDGMHAAADVSARMDAVVDSWVEWVGLEGATPTGRAQLAEVRLRLRAGLYEAMGAGRFDRVLDNAFSRPGVLSRFGIDLTRIPGGSAMRATPDVAGQLSDSLCSLTNQECKPYAWHRPDYYRATNLSNWYFDPGTLTTQGGIGGEAQRAALAGDPIRTQPRLSWLRVTGSELAEPAANVGSMLYDPHPAAQVGLALYRLLMPNTLGRLEEMHRWLRTIRAADFRSLWP